MPRAMNKRVMMTRAVEFRALDNEGSQPVIEGYFAIFDSDYNIFPGAIERIAPGAFDDTLDGDIRALGNHDTTLVLGRTSAGTLTLGVDEKGLFGTIHINENDRQAMDYYERVKRGDINQCSFGFEILEEECLEEGENTVFYIRKVKLYEVSVVAFPAYEDTVATARGKDLDDIKTRKKEMWRRHMLERLKGVRSNGTESADAEKEN